jgi:hypothetical protein
MIKYNKIITEKSNYFLIYLYNILFKLIYGIKINKKQLVIYVFPYKIINCLVFLKYNSITNLSSLVDIVVVDNISYNNNNRFELTYVF